MARRIDQVQHVLAVVPGRIQHARRLGFDRDAPLALQVHGIEHLFGNLAAAHRVGNLQDAVGQR